MPSGGVTPAGGAAFNGGTITKPLTIALANVADMPALTITAPVGSLAAGSDMIRLKREVGSVFGQIDVYGELFLHGDNDGAGNAAGGRLAIFNSQDVQPIFDFNSNADGMFATQESMRLAASQSSSLALGTAYQNTFGYDVVLLVCLNVTVNTSGVLKLGVGPTATPTQTNIISGVTTTGQWNIPIYLPNTYYALLSTTGTITVAIDGQVAMPV